MYALVLFLLAVGVIVALLVGTRNANLLFRATVRNGKVVRFRGRAPKGLMRELEDVLRARPVTHATLRVIMQDRRPFLEARGNVDERELQRLRNVLGTWETAKIRSSPYRSA